MKYNLKSPIDITKSKEYFNKLLEKNANIELREIRPVRSLAQNRYVHLLLSYCALVYGEQLFYFKEIIWKRAIAPDIFKSTYINRKTGEEREHWRSSADLSTKEMTDAIEKLRHFANKQLGVYLPDSSDIFTLQRMENELEKNRGYL